MAIEHVIKIEIAAQEATPAPPLGPKVGQFGLNIMNLCKEFNAATQHIEAGAPVPIVLTIYQNKSFSFVIKSLPSSYFIKKLAVKNTITRDDVDQIIAAKREDLTAFSPESAFNTIMGTARSMGIALREE